MGIFSRKPPPPLAREQVMNARPIRHPALEALRSQDGEISLRLPRRKVWWLNFLAKFGGVPEYHTLTLDKTGSWVWDLCDGTHSVRELIVRLSEEHKLPPKEAEVRMLAYLDTLAQRGLVGMAVGEKPEMEKSEIRNPKFD
jgi:hypothetical protein